MLPAGRPMLRSTRTSRRTTSTGTVRLNTTQSKQNIFNYQQDGDHQIRGEDFKQRRELPLAIPGKHNQLNGIMALTAALRIAQIAPPDSVRALSTFAGLPHRLECIAENGEQRFYNDSKSTVPEATELAVQAFPKPSKVHLIAGGYDKGIDLAPIAHLASKIAGLYTIGTTASAIAAKATSNTNVYGCETLDRAVERAMQAMEADHILLQALASARFSQERHDHFGYWPRRHRQSA